jgi:hypothetical protein
LRVVDARACARRPWITIANDPLNLSVAGIEGDGAVAVAFAAIGGLLGVAKLVTRGRALGVAVMVCGFMTGAIGVYHSGNIGARGLHDSNFYYLLVANPGGIPKVGGGVWVTVAAGVVMFVGGLLGLLRR